MPRRGAAGAHGGDGSPEMAREIGSDMTAAHDGRAPINTTDTPNEGGIGASAFFLGLLSLARSTPEQNQLARHLCQTPRTCSAR